MLSEDVAIYITSSEHKTLKEGTFVKPIEPQYVPKHVKDDPLRRVYDGTKDTYCYTPYGIFPVPRKSIREVE
jgi:hypothetical protein